MDSQMEVIDGGEASDDSGDIRDDSGEMDGDSGEMDGDSSEISETVSRNDYEMDFGANIEKLKRIVKCLLRSDNQVQGQFGNESFYVEDALTLDDIHVDVQDIGKLTLPIDQESAKKLIKISTKAKFGLHEKTIFDKGVPETREISSEKLNVTIKEQSLARMLGEIRKKFGLGGNSDLVPHLHNMLIYGQNHFFANHHDTDKFQNIVATMVIVLPSPHIGGNLLIQHGKKLHTFCSENIFSSVAKCITFYADCMHVIQKVREGHRITLTYNLVSKAAYEDNFSTEYHGLKEAVKDYFMADSEHNKLIYLLNHSYTKQGLKWLLLKREDRVNASALHFVAKELNLVPHLALVEIKETWNMGEGIYYDVTPDLDEEEWENRETTVLNWIDTNDKKLSFRNYCAQDDEICWTKHTRSLKSIEKIFEDSSMDFWYKRAAVVLWPHSQHILMTFELNSDDAIKDLNTLTNELGNEKKIIEAIVKAENKLYRNVIDKKCSIINLLNIALYIKNADKAKLILSNIEWNELNSDTTECFVKLHMQYSIDWLIDLFKTWKDSSYMKQSENFQNVFFGFGDILRAVEPKSLTVEVIHILKNLSIDYENGINYLKALTMKPGNEHKIIKTIEIAGDILFQHNYRTDASAMENLLNIALYIKNANFAQNILSRFEWDVLIPEDAVVLALVQLQIQYGSSWLNTTFHKWENEGKLKNKILEKFGAFVSSFLNFGGDVQIVTTLLEIQRIAIVLFNKSGDTFSRLMNSSKRIEGIGELLESCAKVENVLVLSQVIEYAISNPELYDVISLCELYLNLKNDISSEFFLHFKSLKAYLIKSITKQLATAPKNNWSIDATLPCNCELCVKATNFLQSATDNLVAWPLTKKARLHLTENLNGLNLPLDLTVDNTYSRSKLLLVKNMLLIVDAFRKKIDKCTNYRQRLNDDTK